MSTRARMVYTILITVAILGWVIPLAVAGVGPGWLYLVILALAVPALVAIWRSGPVTGGKS